MIFLALISESLGAILMFLIVVLVAVVALQQFLVTKEKFKLDMFEKRFAVFNSLNLFISESVNKPKVTLESVQKFNGGTQTAGFLFEEDVLNLIHEVKIKVGEIKFLADTLEVMEAGATRQKLLVEKEAKKTELSNLAENSRIAFSNYLKFSKWNHEIIVPDFVNDVIAKIRQ